MKLPAFKGKANGAGLRRVDKLCRDLNMLCHVSQKPTQSVSISRQPNPEMEVVRSRKRARYALEPIQAAASYSSYNARQSTSDDEEDAEELKAQLLDSLYGLDRGLNAGGEIKGEVSELILKLEAVNPTPEPNKALNLLNGSWKLVYTANSELMALLALSKLPGVTVGDILQIIEGGSSVLNKVLLTGPVFETSFSAKASLEVSSPKRLGVRFKEGQVSTPKLIEDLEFPSSITVLGQRVDLTQLKDMLRPVNSSFKDAAKQISSFASRTPDLMFPIPNGANSWLLNTYLDNDLRISRGDGGAIFVLVKDKSSSPSYSSYY